MPVKQRVVEHIIPKKLALIDRVWTNTDQSIWFFDEALVTHQPYVELRINPM